MERWKLLGKNHEDFTVYLDKKTISYPAAYVVKSWTAAVRGNKKKLDQYEVSCLKNNFRVVKDDSVLPSSSKQWQLIFPESTPELIYNAVCPKKRRLKYPSQVKNTPKPEVVDTDNAKKWKLLGENHEDFTVYIDKMRISYPAAYVVKLWTAAVRGNKKKLDQYEIGCLENNFRVANADSDKPSPAGSNKWKGISPESTPELIYNAVCPKKRRSGQKIASR